MQSTGWGLRNRLGLIMAFRSSLGKSRSLHGLFGHPAGAPSPGALGEGQAHPSVCLTCERCEMPPGTTHISELDQTQLPKLGHTAVGSLHLQEELHQAHLLAPEDRGHFACPPPTWVFVEALVAAAQSSLPREVPEGVEHCGNIGITESRCWKLT